MGSGGKSSTNASSIPSRSTPDRPARASNLRDASVKFLSRYVVGIGLMALFLYWAFRGIDAGAMWTAARAVSPWWMAAMAATTVLTLVLRGWRWVVLLRPVAPRVTVLDATLALGVCYSANIALPRAGEAARALSLKWRRGASVSAVLGTVVVERALDLLCLASLLALSLMVVPGRVDTLFPWETEILGTTFTLSLAEAKLWVLAACAAVAAGIACAYAFGERGILAFEAVVGRLSEGLASRLGGMLRSFVRGLVALRSASALAEVVVSSILLNLAYILIIHQSYVAFGFDGPPWSLGTAEALVIMAVSSIGVVIPAPAGTGPYHYFYGYSLHVLFAVPLAAAMACATVVHALANLTYLAVGLPAFLRGRRSRREEGPRAPVGPGDRPPA